VNVHRHELAGLAIGLECKGGIGHGLGEIDLAQNIPGLAAVAGAVGGDAFFERCHIAFSCVVVGGVGARRLGRNGAAV
jgi:hypothetical protein